MAIQSVLSSASIIRLIAPGCPSLIATGLPAVLLLRFTWVRLPPKSVCPLIVWADCPTTNMRFDELVSISALLAPPGMGMFTIGFALAFGQAATAGRLQGSRPEFLFTRKISGETGSRETEEAVPPHSGPQLNT